MRKNTWVVPLCILILASCNFPSGMATPLFPLTTGTPAEVRSTPSAVPIETFLTLQPPTTAPTQTPGLALAYPKGQPVNCRYGPGTSYAIIGELKLGRQAEIVGKSPDLYWWYVKNPSDPSTRCWLAADFAFTEGNVDSLPVVTPPEIGVTDITVNIEPPVINVACTAFPKVVTITAEITTNGPALVVWRWEEKNTGDASPEKSILFEVGGTKIVQDVYLVKSARDYTMVVRAVQPNLFAGEGNFKAVCTP